MALDFEELDYQQTHLGELILRRRRILSLDGVEVFEIILGDAFLMSSLFNVVEIALSDLGLAALKGKENLDVVVGGLGLGYTAQAALKHDSVGSLLVVDALEGVIGWHEKGMVPLGKELSDDTRCRFVHGDFFKLARGEDGAGFDPNKAGRKFDAVLLDIDHTPSKLLDAANASFYETGGLATMRGQLKPDGIFAMWSDDPPDETFIKSLEGVFSKTEAHIVSFHNPLQERDNASTVYVSLK
jgi:spermidine synthase